MEIVLKNLKHFLKDNAKSKPSLTKPEFEHIITQEQEINVKSVVNQLYW